MTDEERAQVVELLRCAANLEEYENETWFRSVYLFAAQRVEEGTWP